MGQIGRALAAKARGLGLRIVVHAPTASVEVLGAYGATVLDLDELAAASDYVSLHVPLTPATAGLIGARFLSRMKPSACLINTARGALVDHDALLGALREGRIAGAAMDVFVPERLAPDHPLLRQENFIATPHVAFYSEEALRDLQTQAAEQVAAVLSGRRPPFVVNPQVLTAERWAHLA